MCALPNLKIDVHLDQGGAPATMAREVLEGLTARQKRLPSKYFYDERGSGLFERITEQPEYYLTRAEQALLEEHAAEIHRIARPEELVELGSGSAKKTRLLIEAGLAAGTLRRYVPVEVSQDMVERSAHRLAERYPTLEVRALVGDFDEHLSRIPDGGRRLVAFLGSTIGNFDGEEAPAFLRKIERVLHGGDWFLLGTDLVKDRRALHDAYNDAAGVTAEFNRNILNVINHHLDGDFDLERFEHVSRWNEEGSRIESYLRSVGDQRVHLAAIGLDVVFADGELLWTEVSCKYTRESVTALLAEVGLVLEHWFADADGAFALSLSRLA